MDQATRTHTVEHERTTSSGAFVIFQSERRIGELTWNTQREGLIKLDHTWISPKARGQNLGQILIEHAVSFAREEQLMVNPTCPYIEHIFDGTDAYDDIDIRRQ